MRTHSNGSFQRAGLTAYGGSALLVVVAAFSACGTHADKSGTVEQAATGGSIAGYIDSVVPQGDGSVVVNGWACAVGVPQSIYVDVYANGAPTAGGIFVAGLTANNPNEQAVNDVCQDSGVNHRFSYSASAATVSAFADQPIYLWAVNPNDSSGGLLVNSGSFRFPGATTLANGQGEIGVNTGGTLPGALAGSLACITTTNAYGYNGTRLVAGPCQPSSLSSYAVVFAWDGQHLKDTASGRCLDVPGGDTSYGNQVQLWDCNGLPQQSWKYDPNTFQFIGLHGVCLDDWGDGTSGSIGVVPCNGSMAQSWYTAWGVGGFGALASDADVNHLHYVTAGGMGQGNLNQPYANGTRPWMMDPRNNSYVESWTYNAFDRSIRPTGPYGGQYCLDVTGGVAANGTQVQLFGCNGTPAQQWTWNGHALVSGVSTDTPFCLDLPAWNLSSTYLEIWQCNGGSNQGWTFINEDGSTGHGPTGGQPDGGVSCSEWGGACSTAIPCCDNEGPCGTCTHTCGGQSGAQNGESCSQDSDCCSSICSNGVCQ